MDQQFWITAGAAATIATALATGTSTIVALWWRKDDKPDADWAFSVRGVLVLPT